mmetsp:Transcript_61940/g.102860  ORF Transcript_61940/g.102860 Transcript_61940/m.102860 type:complete len:88 (-) Transcript_61940:30-293(-)
MLTHASALLPVSNITCAELLMHVAGQGKGEHHSQTVERDQGTSFGHAWGAVFVGPSSHQTSCVALLCPICFTKWGVFRNNRPQICGS